jgi:hypothetical protein
MSATLEPLPLSPREATAFLSISKRSLSRLIRAGKIEARKAGPRTLVDVAWLIRPPGARGTAAAQPDPSFMFEGRA